MNIGYDLTSLVYNIVALIIFPFILRFLLQASRADFYNPISQFIVRFTNPLAMPLRKVLPSQKGFDIASLVLAYVIQVILIVGLFTLGSMPFDWFKILPWAAISLLNSILNLYFWGLLVVVISSWVAPNSYNPALILINQLLEPIVSPIRRVIPDLGGLDFSPLVLILALQVAEILVIRPLAMATLLGYQSYLYKLLL